MDDPQHLRAHAVRLYALALKIRDSQPAYADMITNVRWNYREKRRP
jgi:hypothetical protein